MLVPIICLDVKLRPCELSYKVAKGFCIAFKHLLSVVRAVASIHSGFWG